VKDRLGQTLFGDNTFAHHPSPQRVGAGEMVEAIFSFEMPVLLPGEYTIAAAIADGSQTEHLMLQWVHDAAMFTSVAIAHHRGIVGIPISVQIRTSSVLFSPQRSQSTQRGF
jgi:lipopolysaccharide transport system ATP-binding protein